MKKQDMHRMPSIHTMMDRRRASATDHIWSPDSELMCILENSLRPRYPTYRKAKEKYSARRHDEIHRRDRIFCSFIAVFPVSTNSIPSLTLNATARDGSSSSMLEITALASRCAPLIADFPGNKDASYVSDNTSRTFHGFLARDIAICRECKVSI
jgi:hypothetical protein